jgi:hypothetical protein
MMNKTIPLYIVFCFTILSGCNISEQSKFSEKKIVSTLKEFYSEYISEGNKLISEEQYAAILKIRQKYCTQRLLDEIDKYTKIVVIDYDPFTNAQDFDINWLKTLNISKDSVKNDIYHVSYYESYRGKYEKIKLSVVKEGDSYKIDKVYSIIPLIDNYGKERK